ncbi:hypothetical protein CPB86DRAFT_389436 [Serendipita vermifera]|nr:hypothetical protein CPB86DRAFT_389436 [Serendipita vermifera]
MVSIFIVFLLFDIDATLCCRRRDSAFPFLLAKIVGYFETIEYYMYNAVDSEDLEASFRQVGLRVEDEEIRVTIFTFTHQL